MNALPEVLRYLRIAPVLAPDCLVLKAVMGWPSVVGSKPPLGSRVGGSPLGSGTSAWQAVLRLPSHS